MTDRGRVILLLAVVVVILVVLIVREAADDGPSSSPTISPSVGGSAPSATGQPSASAEVTTAWRTLATIPGTVSSVVESEIGWFAVGSTPGGSTQLFTSSDGISWQTTDPGPIRGGYRIWEAGPALVVAGTTADIDFGTPLLWFSPDGLAWTESAPMGDDRFGAITDIVQLEGALLAVGNVGPSANPDDDQGVVWRTEDLATWSETPLGGSYVARGFPQAPIVLVGGAGGPRVSGGELEPRRGADWISSNSIAWTPMPPDPQLDSAWIMDAVAADERLIAVGAQWDDHLSTGTPSIWGSVDATDWTLDEVGTCCGQLLAVARVGSDLVAVASMTDRTAMVYRSADGLVWQEDGTMEGFVGEIYDFAETRSFGPVLIASAEAGATLLLLPPTE
jgi:hypothetical protein